MATDLVRVRLLRRVHRPGVGGGWNAGETAGFPATEAAHLVAIGAAELVPLPQKSLERPNRDRMLKSDGVTRK